MPILREWIIHHPRDWTSVQAHAYMQDTTAGFSQAIHPVMVAVGPARAASVLLTIIVQIARVNPVWIENIKDGMANAYDLIEKMAENAAPPTTKH